MIIKYECFKTQNHCSQALPPVNGRQTGVGKPVAVCRKSPDAVGTLLAVCRKSPDGRRDASCSMQKVPRQASGRFLQYAESRIKLMHTFLSENNCKI
jgi:hypothetical protein